MIRVCVDSLRPFRLLVPISLIAFCLFSTTTTSFQIASTSRHQRYHRPLRSAIHQTKEAGHSQEPENDAKGFCLSRRVWFTRTLLSSASFSVLSPSIVLTSNPPRALANEGNDSANGFRTKAYTLKEYTNSIVASKDTNVSPKEAYDVLSETIAPIAVETKKTKSNNPNLNRALDVGAGAGVSTQTLYEMGFTKMDAVDWSGLAWNDNVLDCPPSVQFFEMDDESYFRQKAGDKKYQVIVYNFAINMDKAILVAKQYLDPELENARLLVPANAQKDYWYKQTYYLINAKGDIVWKSKPDVGAWSVQFQPDVTSDTCQGIWCPPYNGFVKKR